MVAELSSEARAAYERDILGRIDAGGTAAVAAEWELLVVSQLAKTGALRIVPATFGRSRPDAIFACRATNERAVVEVTAISDEEIQDRYPADTFAQLFYTRLRKLRDEHVGSFDVNIGSCSSADGQPELALPSRKNLDAFFASPEVRRYLRAIAASPDAARTFIYEHKQVHTAVVFKPGAQFSYTSGSAYSVRMFNNFTEARLLRRIRMKARQVNASGLCLPSILVICDNDCHILRHHKTAPWERKGTLQSISTHIQGRPSVSYGGPWIERGAPQQTTAINAVFTLWVDEHRHWPNGVTRALAGAFVPNDRKVKYTLSSQAMASFASILEGAPAFLRTPANARNANRWPEHFGGWAVSGSKLRLSKLAVQDLLTGKLSYEEFAAAHEFPIQQLQRLTAEGLSLKSIEVIDTPDVDDDWLELDFSANDPRSLGSFVDRR